MSAPNLRELHAQIQSHPGKHAHDRWENLRLTFQGIYQANRKQLLDLMEAPNHNEELLIELIQNVRPRVVKEAYEFELLKAFHNYIASALTLVDHSRRFIKEYTDTTFSKEYDQKRAAVASTEEHCFLKDIRNYVVHRDIPPLGYTVNLENDHFAPFFNSTKLKEWNKWSSGAKSLLAQAEEKMLIVPIIETHGKMIDEFYGWIFEQFHILHGKEIDEVNELIRQTRPPHLDNQS